MLLRRQTLLLLLVVLFFKKSRRFLGIKKITLQLGILGLQNIVIQIRLLAHARQIGLGPAYGPNLADENTASSSTLKFLEERARPVVSWHITHK